MDFYSFVMHHVYMFHEYFIYLSNESKHESKPKFYVVVIRSSAYNLIQSIRKLNQIKNYKCYV